MSSTSANPRFSHPEFDVVVVGAGPTGLAAALGLADAGLSVALIRQAAKSPPRSSETASQSSSSASAERSEARNTTSKMSDSHIARHEHRRTAALLDASIALLRNLCVWEACASHSQPLSGIRIVDDTGGLLRAPEIVFRSSELGLDQFGYNVPNGVLSDAMTARAEGYGTGIAVIDTAAADAFELETDAGMARVRLAEGRWISAHLIVGADGRNSPSRAAAGIAARTSDRGQSALTCSFTHGRPHGDISTEFHLPAGPCTAVPLPGNASALVWVERRDEAERLAALDDAKFVAALEHRLQGLLGSIGAVSPRTLFPLVSLEAERFAARRVALVGEAAHVMPPIGAQGLNLGFRDVAVLVDTLNEARVMSADIGAPETLDAYSRARRRDIAGRMFAVDMLNASLTSDLLPAHLLRGAGLHALKAIGPLRRQVMRTGIVPSRHLPRLMQQLAH
jgi:2-octaprenyl-6-methoxyphenol hydroxylase